MKLKLIVAALVSSALPLCGQAQESKTPQTQKIQKAQKSPKTHKAPEPTKAAPINKVTAAQNLVKTISADNAKRQNVL